jgi:hypothetical protein
VAGDHNHITFKFPSTSQPNKLSCQMTTLFSQTDTAQIALASSMPCLRSVSSSHSLRNNRRPNASSGEELPEPYNTITNRIPRARPDELQGLAADSSDNERGETLSSHSNPRWKRKKGGGTKTEVQVQCGCEWETSEDNFVRV